MAFVLLRIGLAGGDRTAGCGRSAGAWEGVGLVDSGGDRRVWCGVGEIDQDILRWVAHPAAASEPAERSSPEGERSNAFYHDVMGAALVKRGNGWAYRFGETQLNCHGPGVGATPVARLPVQPGNSDLCFVWPGPIDIALEHLKRRDVAIELGPIARHGARDAGTSVYFRDPDGSLLEFISYG